MRGSKAVSFEGAPGGARACHSERIREGDRLRPPLVSDGREVCLSARLARESPQTIVAAVRRLNVRLQAEIVSGLRQSVQRELEALEVAGRR
jgi:hypothetical protein